MDQLRLFPPPGGLARPLPTDELVEASELLAEMLAVVIENEQGQYAIASEGETDE